MTSAAAFDERLLSRTRRTPVTWVLVAANVVLFMAMALTHGRLFHFNSDVLLTWGGGLAPRVFGTEWWRAGSSMFVHGDLAHLAGNLLFLLLLGPLVERLLGSFRLALVYLFAGLGGGLLAMGTHPQQVVVGASAAVYGVYGALLGCCLRGPRSIPWRAVAQRSAVLLLYTAVSLVSEWLNFEQQGVAHLGGFVYGLIGGLLCGHQLQPRAGRLCRLAVIFVVCGGLIDLTARGVHHCADKALACYQAFAQAKDRERNLLGQFGDALRQWEDGEITDGEWKQILDQRLIPAWQDTRTAAGLKLTGELAELEGRPFSMQDFWTALRAISGERKTHDEEPLTVEEYGKMYRLLGKVRLDTWRALASELPGNRILLVRALMDVHELEQLYAAFDARVNEGNPLYGCFELKRRGDRTTQKASAEPDGGFLKNRGFEAGLEGWITYTVGPPSRFEFDSEVAREGRQALRITAPQPTDTGCRQDLVLKPGQRYRFSGWVRTRGVQAFGARVWGTLSVCHAGTNNLIAQAENHAGDTEWTQVSILFQAPADGQTRFYAHLSGWGRAAGIAWFDDLKLVEVSQP
jgi:membrane associated rhomboid family serine protease